MQARRANGMNGVSRAASRRVRAVRAIRLHASVNLRASLRFYKGACLREKNEAAESAPVLLHLFEVVVHNLWGHRSARERLEPLLAYSSLRGGATAATIQREKPLKTIHTRQACRRL
eukprot:2746748-Pleurochrysis_carterae.AAC.1